MRHIAFLFTSFLLTLLGQTQALQPGFDKEEYIELMRVSAQTTADTGYANRQPKPQRFTMFYRSPVLGLDNRYDLWTNDKGVAVVSLRGTTKNQQSWLENFYAAMTPARGSLQLPDGSQFAYDLSGYPNAAVHAGWLLGLAFLGTDMFPKIDSVCRAGTRNLLVVGHSQGGAIAYLLTAYLRQKQKAGGLPADLRIKTYCSAAPKPGNLPFAYDYEAATQSGWAFNVVNSADWVPETPISIQTLTDFNRTNPFSGARGTIRKLKFPANLAMRHVFNRLSNSTAKARRTYTRYLGDLTGKRIRKLLKGMELPPAFNSNHYVRTGQFVVLLADSAYYQRHPDTANNVFVHHVHAPYVYLAERLQAAGATSATPPKEPVKTDADSGAGAMLLRRQ